MPLQLHFTTSDYYSYPVVEATTLSPKHMMPVKHILHINLLVLVTTATAGLLGSILFMGRARHRDSWPRTRPGVYGVTAVVCTLVDCTLLV